MAFVWRTGQTLTLIRLRRLPSASPPDSGLVPKAGLECSVTGTDGAFLAEGGLTGGKVVGEMLEMVMIYHASNRTTIGSRAFTLRCKSPGDFALPPNLCFCDPGVYLEDIEHYAGLAISSTSGLTVDQYVWQTVIEERRSSACLKPVPKP